MRTKLILNVANVSESDFLQMLDVLLGADIEHEQNERQTELWLFNLHSDQASFCRERFRAYGATPIAEYHR